MALARAARIRIHLEAGVLTSAELRQAIAFFLKYLYTGRVRQEKHAARKIVMGLGQSNITQEKTAAI